MAGDEPTDPTFEEMHAFYKLSRRKTDPPVIELVLPSQQRPVITPERMRELLEEGRQCRLDLEKRIKKMHEIQCTCFRGTCSVHDKAV